MGSRYSDNIFTFCVLCTCLKIDNIQRLILEHSLYLISRQWSMLWWKTQLQAGGTSHIYTLKSKPLDKSWIRSFLSSFWLVGWLFQRIAAHGGCDVHFNVGNSGLTFPHLEIWLYQPYYIYTHQNCKGNSGIDKVKCSCMTVGNCCCYVNCQEDGLVLCNVHW